MNRGKGSVGAKDAAPATAANDTEEQEPDVPQNGFGKFEYIN